MKRYMGLDVGDRTVGVALSDLLLLTAQGLETIRRESIKKDTDRIIDIIEEENVEKIIVGLPKNMNNTLGPQGKKVIEFIKKLENKLKHKKLDIEIVYEDERLTTVAAERLLLEGDVSRSDRKKVIDKVAASYILQSYLDREKRV